MRCCTMRRPASNQFQRTAAFTLVEVVLAIGIAVGLLVVALHFYQQATNLRGQLIEESDRLSAIRLVMDRITSDLRTALAQPQEGFTGTPDSMRFVKADMPARADWRGGAFGRATSVETDLKRVSYSLSALLEGTNALVAGLSRSEEPWVEQRPLAGAKVAVQASIESAGTNQPATGPVIESIRFARFRYWDGSGWQDSWDSSDLPRGVEVSLGAEPLPLEEAPESYPYELFRRVIYLPGVGPGLDVLDETWLGALAR